MALSAQVAPPLTLIQQQQQQQHQYTAFTFSDLSLVRHMSDPMEEATCVGLQLEQQHQHNALHLHQLQQHQQQQQQLAWTMATPVKFECASSDGFPWSAGFTHEFLANNDAYYNQNTTAAAVAAEAAAATAAATSSAASGIVQISQQASVTVTTPLDATAGSLSVPSPVASASTCSATELPADLNAECIGTESLAGPYDLQLRLEEKEPQPEPSFHQRLNASGGSSLWYAIGFANAEKQIMQRALTTPEEKITKSIVLRNREVLASLWCKELVPVRLYLHGNFTAALADNQAARLVIRCGAFKQQHLPVKECCVCCDVKHRGGWYGADKRDTNSSKNIPESLQKYWPSDANQETLHRGSLVIVRNDTCAYHTDSRGRVYALMPVQQRSSAPIELLLYYTCMTTHSHDTAAPNSKDTFTSVQLETLDAQSGAWLVKGRCVFRMRMVTSPERDILNEVTQFLTPAQMGCRLGCGHLESHNTRWQRAKILRNQGQDKLDYYLHLYGSEPGVKKLKGSTSDAAAVSDEAETLADTTGVVASCAAAATATAQSDSLSLEVSEQEATLVIRGGLLSNPESCKLVADALRAYLASLPLIVRGVAAASAAAAGKTFNGSCSPQHSSSSDRLVTIKTTASPVRQVDQLGMSQQQQQQQHQQFQPQNQHHQHHHQQLQLQQQQQQQQTQHHLRSCLESPCRPQQNSPTESLHSLHCSSAASSMSEHITYHMPDLGMSSAELPPNSVEYQLSQQPPSAPSSVQYYTQVSSGQCAYPASVYFSVNPVVSSAASTASTMASSTVLPPLQHVLMPQQHQLQHQHQLLVTAGSNPAGFGQDQVDGLMEATVSELDAKEQQPSQELQQEQQHQHQHQPGKSVSTRLLKRLVGGVNRRKHRVGISSGGASLTSLFKSKQRLTFNN